MLSFSRPRLSCVVTRQDRGGFAAPEVVAEAAAPHTELLILLRHACHSFLLGCVASPGLIRLLLFPSLHETARRLDDPAAPDLIFLLPRFFFLLLTRQDRCKCVPFVLSDPMFSSSFFRMPILASDLILPLFPSSSASF